MTSKDEKLVVFGPFVYARVGVIAILSFMGYDLWARVDNQHAFFGRRICRLIGST